MKTISRKAIEAKAKEMLEKCQITEAPVPVERIAQALGLTVEEAKLGEEVSGVLVVSAGKGTIGFNSSQSFVRQRFTIAHELGHYLLHFAPDKLFIDKKYTAVFNRDQNSATGEQLEERQANQFAAALLMPEELLRKELDQMHFDLTDEHELRELALRFGVSGQAMTLRLARLGITTGQ